MTQETALSLLLLACALWLRPWRMLGHVALRTPWLAALAILPLLWSLPLRHAMPLQLQWSGAPLLVLCLGWPLAVPTLGLIGVATWLLSSATPDAALRITFWQGLLPATFALLIGALLRKYLPHHPFVYVLGRAFLGTVLSLFASSLLADLAGHSLPNIGTELAWVAHWLMAWGDAFVTGLIAAIFVAFRPEWLATWSDRLYLRNAGKQS